MSVSQVSDWLWVSGAPDAGAMSMLGTKGVRYVIDTTAECNDQPFLLPTQSVIRKLGWSDDGQLKLVDDFLSAYNGVLVAMMAEWTRSRTRAGVLVHCGAGVNRGPTATTFLVAAFDGTSGEDAWKRVVASHPESNGWNVPAYRQSIIGALARLQPVGATP